ncbi:MAG: ATP synthase F0 subunit C [Planctomycetota bacterium]
MDLTILAGFLPLLEEALSLHGIGAALGAGVTIVGGGLGIGKLAASAMEGMARQPEASGDIRGGMILAAALIEGVTLLALVICVIVSFK